MTNSVYVTQNNFIVYGTSRNKNQTDQYALTGTGDTFVNLGGNINITGIINPPGTTPTDSNTTVQLGNAVTGPEAITGVTDTFTLDGNTNSLTNNGTITGSIVTYDINGTGGFNSVNLIGSYDTVDVETGLNVAPYVTANGGNSVTLNNTFGANTVGLGAFSGPNTVTLYGTTNTVTGYGTGNNVTVNGGAGNWTYPYGGTNTFKLGDSATVSADGVTNTVTTYDNIADVLLAPGTGQNSTVSLNGNATNSVTIGNGAVTIGFTGDKDYYNAVSYSSVVTLGAGATNVHGGDEAFSINQTGSAGGDGVTLGDGENSVYLTGANNTVQVGGGDNTIVAGTTLYGVGNEIVKIVGISNTNGPAYVPDPNSYFLVPVSPTDSVTITGSGDKVSATYENVVISGASASKATVSLGNGNNQVYLGGSGGYNTVTVGDGANSLNIAGNANNIMFGDGSNNGITVSGNFNTLSETTTDGGGVDNIQLGAGLGDSVYLYNAGGTVTGTGVSGDYETTVSQLPTAKAQLNVNLGNGAGDITLGNGNDTVVSNDIDGYGTTISAGNGNDKVTANGAGAGITLGNGNDSVTANGFGDLISLGNGNSTVTANGGGDTFTFGSGSNHLTANGGDNTGTFGSPGAPAGNTTLTATGSGDSWTAYEAFNKTLTATLGSADSLTQYGGSLNGSLTGDGDMLDLYGTKSLTTNISESGNGEEISFNADAGGTVNLNPSSVSDFLTVYGDGYSGGTTGSYSGAITFNGLSSSDYVDLQGLSAADGTHINSFAAFVSELTPTLSGGEVLNLQGGGSINFSSNAILALGPQLEFSGWNGGNVNS